MTLLLHDHLAPEVRDKFAADYARKLAPNYRLRHKKPTLRLARDYYTGPSPSGERVYDPFVRRKVWRFAGWQFDQAAADAFSDYVGDSALGRLIRLTPRHNEINAANPPKELSDD